MLINKNLILLATFLGLALLTSCMEPEKEFIDDNDDNVSQICIDYCDNAISKCVEPHSFDMGFNSKEECRTMCSGITQRISEDLEDLFSGDTVQCRLNLLDLMDSEESPLSDDITCGSAAIDGGTLCVDFNSMNCVFYCGRLRENCLDTFNDEYFGDEEKCVDECPSIFGIDNIGDIGELAGNTIGCRSTFAYLAGEDASLCRHASHDSDVCK